MATEQQTNFSPIFLTFLMRIKNVMYYFIYVVKLYIIGVVALVYQLKEKYVPVRGLPSQEGQTAVVTGGTAGIGLHISKQLASLGAQVIIASRSKEDAEIAIATIKQDCPNAKVVFMKLDLASFKSVRTFAAEFLSQNWPLHVLINNAGVMLVPFHVTEDGYEYHLQVNYLSHALLTSLLREKMDSSASAGRPSRVVNVSSVVHHVAAFNSKTFTEKPADSWEYSPHNAYAVSKLAILLYTFVLSQKLAGDKSNILINAVHPGIVNTSLYWHIHWSISWVMDIVRCLLFMSPEQAAAAVVYVATSLDVDGKSGCYFSNCKRVESSVHSKLSTLQQDVYTKTCEVIGKKYE